MSLDTDVKIDLNIDFKSSKFKKVQEILADPKKQFIIVDGVIGAGKTTVISLIEKKINSDGKLKIKAIYEPVKLWNDTGALQYFYDNIEKHCYEFQTYSYITRIQSVIDEIYKCQDADIYILERSIWTDKYIFMELLKELVGEMRFNMYNTWWDMWSYIMPMRVDKWVLLDTSLEESLKRINSRNRNGESAIDKDYQTNLYVKHIEFYNKLKEENKPVIIIESNIMDTNFLEDSDKIDKIIDLILQELPNSLGSKSSIQYSGFF
jgi:deoxyadenosine/deoxycytidine kinase